MRVKANIAFCVATDAAGNQAIAAVTLDIITLMRSAPTITSAAETVVVDTDETNPVIYTATADDSADISDGVSFSLNDTTAYASTDSAFSRIYSIHSRSCGSLLSMCMFLQALSLKMVLKKLW